MIHDIYFYWGSLYLFTDFLEEKEEEKEQVVVEEMTFIYRNI